MIFNAIERTVENLIDSVGARSLKGFLKRKTKIVIVRTKQR